MEINPTIDDAVKIVTVGDALVGKSCAITKFETSVAPIERTSTIFQSSKAVINIDGKQIPLQIWDTTSKQVYSQIVTKSVYTNADVFLIFFSVTDPDSYQHAIAHWFKSINDARPNALKVFVGNKIDLRNKGSIQNAVQEHTAHNKITGDLKCKYFECSAVTGQGLHQVFQYCVRQHFQKTKQIPPGSSGQATSNRTQRRQDKGCCSIM